MVGLARENNKGVRGQASQKALKFRTSKITGNTFISVFILTKILSNFYYHFVCFLHKSVHLTKKIALALNIKIRSTFVKAKKH